MLIAIKTQYTKCALFMKEAIVGIGVLCALFVVFIVLPVIGWIASLLIAGAAFGVIALVAVWVFQSFS